MPDLKIENVKAREVLDCRGLPTVQVDVILRCGIMGRASVPAGLSKGAHEAKELRDGEDRYKGLGVMKAVENVNRKIAPAVIGMDASRHRKIDRIMIELDGTEDKSRLGANAILGVSLACAKAAAAALALPLYRYINLNAHVLPVPMVNLINGGRHASNDLDFQEFIIMPVGAASFSEALRISSEINLELREILVKRCGKMAINVGDEGGYSPPFKEAREALDSLMEAVAKAGYEDIIVCGLDVAASHLYDPEREAYSVEGRWLKRDELIKYYQELARDYRIISIEDPLHEDDFEGFAIITRELGIQIVGDDLFATNPSRIRRGAEVGAANALLCKVNQIGTLTEALTAAEMAKRRGFGLVVSERSGETEDDMIADICVGLNAGQIKTGAPVRGERTSKYNRLLQIEEDLGSDAVYAGHDFRRPV